MSLQQLVFLAKNFRTPFLTFAAKSRENHFPLAASLINVTVGRPHTQSSTSGGTSGTSIQLYMYALVSCMYAFPPARCFDVGVASAYCAADGKHLPKDRRVRACVRFR